MSAFPFAILPTEGPAFHAVLVLLAFAGLAGGALSFTRRWGRSRWPFHVALATAIASLALANLAGSDSDNGHLLSVLALILGLFAAVRAAVSTFRDSGPRF
ncbi:MAG: hypothetical protein KDM91_11625 [Verrucomicrobiae bacterium]|nr:hypothetical protein [Verrucomicrobiae bacterium]MCP5539728.1 hypothetical protein [Akkermansiaceae bacterium]MCP5549465.1 hypothetical protein [Akkermansiaceae bacterium]